MSRKKKRTPVVDAVIAAMTDCQPGEDHMEWALRMEGYDTSDVQHGSNGKVRQRLAALEMLTAEVKALWGRYLFSLPGGVEQAQLDFEQELQAQENNKRWAREDAERRARWEEEETLTLN